MKVFTKSILCKLKRIIYLSPIAKNTVLHWMRYKLRHSWNISVIKKFGRESDNSLILPQMKRANMKYRWNALEYFLFQYEKLSDTEKLNFCSEFDHNAFCLRVNNWDKAQDFRDKWKTYLLFKPFFKRECILISNISDLQNDSFQNFISENNMFLMKSLEECCGRGIYKVTRNDLKPLQTYVSRNGKCIL